jgi:hypothetical protein
MTKSNFRTILLAGVALAAASGVSAQADNFPTAPYNESLPSNGAFSLILSQKYNTVNWQGALSALNFQQKFGRWISPSLHDPATIMGMSASFLQNGPVPTTGAIVGAAAGAAPGYTPQNVTLSDFSSIPASFGPPLAQVPGDGKELFTVIESMNMTNGPISVLAGAAADPALNLSYSYGQVQSGFKNLNNGMTDFPAQSFFDIFVEISIMGVELFNKTAMVVQNTEPLYQLPPNNLYAHGASQNAVQLYFATSGSAPNGLTWNAGDIFGAIALTNHNIAPTLDDLIALGDPSAAVFAATAPETSTWAMMLLGFGGLGLAARRQVKQAGAIAGA